MPTAPHGPCSTPGCGNIQPCDIHRGSTTKRTPAPTDGIYHTRRWKVLSKRVLAEEPLCHWCKVRPSTVADHVVELRDGGAPFDRAGIVGSCGPCNVGKGQKAAQRRRASSLT